MKKLRQIKWLAGIVSLLIAVALIVMFFVLKMDVFIAMSIYFAMLVVLFFTVYAFERIRQETGEEIEKNLDQGIKDALNFAYVGMLVYNEEFVITWMSSLFAERSIDRLGEKLLLWLPELQDLIKGDVDRVYVKINEETYEVQKRDNDFVLYFKDISKEVNLREKIDETQLVIGYVNFDNYDETAEVEGDISYINFNIKVPVFEYFKSRNIVYKSLYNNRLLLILDEQKYAELRKDRFSIINVVRKEAKKAGFDITLSMAFARGDIDSEALDAMALSLIDLAQTRGGDQVVVRKSGEEAVYFGGSSEAREKQSKVRVRVISNTIRDLINKSSNVIIVGHQDMDADCVGSALCMASIVKSYGKDAAIIAKSGGVEPMIQDVLNRYKDEIDQNYDLVSENEAINRLHDDSLVIMVDHHSASQSNGSNLLKMAKRVVIIDHHRRNADLDTSPILVYVEASASSSCELTAEFLPYLLRKATITPNIANIMYIGLVIDTNHFRVRTGARTFDVARVLRQYGADPVVCESLMQEPFEMVKKRSSLIDNAERYLDIFAISAVSDGIYPRSIISQASDQMLQMKEISAAFVITQISKDEVGISARSKNNFNVQVVMEKMHGGGHMTAAGLQRKDERVEDLKAELLEILKEYKIKEQDNESNTVE